MVLFGIGFKVPDLSSLTQEKTFNVVLAQFEAEKRHRKVGIEWLYIPGNSLSPKNVKNTFNS